MGKGEIVRYTSNFSFSQCFRKACFPGASKGVIVWEWVKDAITAFLIVFFNPLNLLPKNKIFDVTKLKAFADEKLNVAKMTISLFYRVRNTVEKGENADYQHFLLFPQCFLKPSSLGSLNVRIV